MITKIQSFTDVITNSSSTVFVMDSHSANYYDQLEGTDGGITIEPITFNWLLNNACEAEMVCALLNVNMSEITDWHDSKYGGWWNTPDKETWEAFLELHKEEIDTVFKDLYWVDIEDHFTNAYEITEEACYDARWYESRH